MALEIADSPSIPAYEKPLVSYMPDARPPPSYVVESNRGGFNPETRNRARENATTSMQDDLELDPTDYAVIVKMRGPADRPWKWEITAPGNKKPLQRSSENFLTMSAALRDGREALRVFLKHAAGGG